MKYIFFLLLFLFPAVVVCGQDINSLEKFKTGKFTYEGQEGKVEIIRTKKTQTEIYNNGESKLILDIKWINDSTYMLTHKKSINAPGCLKKGDWIKSTITGSNGNKYFCKFTSNNCGGGEAVFIKLE